MKILIAGGTGMVGSLILKNALDNPKVTEVISLLRKAQGNNHPKLKEVVIDNFEDYSAHADLFQDLDAAHFCIGVYTGQVDNALFEKITVNYAVKFAEAIKANSPNARLCMLSGAGADRTEKSRTAFAKFKGRAENLIFDMVIEFYTFRPAYIYPVTKREEPNLMYTFSRAIYPIFKLMGKNLSIKSTELAQAMFNVGMTGTQLNVLENKDILDLV